MYVHSMWKKKCPFRLNFHVKEAMTNTKSAF